MEHMLVWSELTCDGVDLIQVMRQLLTLKKEFTDYKFKTDNIIESLNTKYETAIKALNETRTNCTSLNTNCETVIQGLNKTLMNQTSELQALEETSHNNNTTVGFIATKNTTSQNCNGSVSFDNIVMNNGSGFDTTSRSYFKAHVSGIYFFSVQLCYSGNGTYYGQNTNNVNLMLYSPTRNQIYGASHYQHNYESCSSMTTTAYLSTHDTIGVYCHSTGDILKTVDEWYVTSYWTMFTGALLN